MPLLLYLSLPGNYPEVGDQRCNFRTWQTLIFSTLTLTTRCFCPVPDLKSKLWSQADNFQPGLLISTTTQPGLPNFQIFIFYMDFELYPATTTGQNPQISLKINFDIFLNIMGEKGEFYFQQLNSQQVRRGLIFEDYFFTTSGNIKSVKAFIYFQRGI